ncbi:hypothetical protein ACFFHM_05700 [Halalkalibacter kiskunsagensis]|uniref:Uncharacterized protein n=1 Tax=Halalkalibacter kiskunsagensis TaxID=1548599 RepID=A0ABV6K9P5_9BACI
MEQSRYSSTQDIDTLKQKLVAYKKTLEALKGGGVIEDYLLPKKEYEELKNQVSTLKGEIKTMKDKQDVQIHEYEKKVEVMTTHVELVNNTMRDLKQDVSLLMSKVSNIDFSDILKKIDKMVDIQYASISSIKDGNNELNVLKEEIAQLKQQTNNQATANTDNVNQNMKTKPSSYRQLQNILQSSKSIQPYSNGGNRMVPLRKDPIQQMQRQGIPPEVKQIKRGSMNAGVPIQPREFNVKNQLQNKTSKGNKSSYSIPGQQNSINPITPNQKAHRSTNKAKSQIKQTNNEAINNSENKEDN